MRTTIRERIRSLKGDTYALYLVGRDPRTPWYAKAVALVTVAYALSPIDLIPDFIPVLGYVDDLVLIPLGLWVAIRLVPPEVLSDARRVAASTALDLKAAGRTAAVVVVVLWVLGALLIAWVVWSALH